MAASGDEESVLDLSHEESEVFPYQFEPMAMPIARGGTNADVTDSSSCTSDSATSDADEEQDDLRQW